MIGIFQEDDLVVARGGTKFCGVAGHLGRKVFGVNLRVGIGGGDPKTARSIPVHVHGFFQ